MNMYYQFISDICSSYQIILEVICLVMMTQKLFNLSLTQFV